MKEKILAAINAKFLGVKLSKKRIEQITKFVEEEVIDDESKIEAALTLFNKINPVADLAKTDAEIRGLNKKVGELEGGVKPKKDGDESAATGKSEKDDNDEGEKIPKWAADMAKELKEIRAEKAVTTTRDKLAQDLKDIPGALWQKRQMPTSEEEYTAFVDDVKADHAALKKDGLIQDLKNVGNPGGGQQQQQQNGSKEVPAELKTALQGAIKKPATVMTISGPVTQVTAPAGAK
jgi:hypothetical protein